MDVLGVIALIAAALFAGAAIYINVAEQPARLLLDDRSMLMEWGPAYKRGLVMQVSLILLAGGSGLTTWLNGREPLWLIGSLTMLINLPYTLAIIMPVNKQLEATRPEQASPATRALIVRWGVLHAGRSALGAIATLLFAGALIRSS